MTASTISTTADGELVVDDARRRAGHRLIAGMAGSQRRRLSSASAAVIVSTAAVVTMPALVKVGIDDVIGKKRVWFLLVILAVFVALACIDYVMQFLAQRLVGLAAETSVRDLRVALFRHIMSQPLGFFERMRSGRVISRMTSD